MRFCHSGQKIGIQQVVDPVFRAARGEYLPKVSIDPCLERHHKTLFLPVKNRLMAAETSSSIHEGTKLEWRGATGAMARHLDRHLLSTWSDAREQEPLPIY